MDLLKKAARNAVKHCLAIKPKEKVLVITDEPLRKIGYYFFEAAREAGAEVVLTEILPRARNGEEPPSPVAELMKLFEVLIIPTSKSLSHTQARREACQQGARCATLPGILADTMKRTLNADYSKIAERSNRVAQAMQGGRVIHLRTKSGTDITFSMEGRNPHPDTGVVHNPGDFSNLPAGEAYLAPVEGTAQGVMVIDGAMAGIGKVNKPIKMRVKDGFVVEISGGAEAKILQKLLEPVGQLAYNVAELGIGTNDKAKIIGSVLEDEKVLGTVHMAIGDNMSMGGTVSVPSHLDGIMTRPTLEVDGKVIMKEGVLKL